MAYFKASPFPFISGISLEEGNTTPQVDSTLYRQFIGILLYLTHSRPDICYFVNVVLRYMQKPHEIHWRESNRILQYVQGIRTYGIHYATDSKLDLVGFTDSDWDEDSIYRKPTSCYVFMFSGDLFFG